MFKTKTIPLGIEVLKMRFSNRIKTDFTRKGNKKWKLLT